MLYDRIKALCKEKGVTITEMEKDLGYARGSLYKIDKHKPSAEKVKAIADYFDISQDELTGVQTNEHEEYYFDYETREIAELLHKNRGLKMLFDAARDMSADDMLLIYGLVQRMKKTNPNE